MTENDEEMRVASLCLLTRLAIGWDHSDPTVPAAIGRWKIDQVLSPPQLIVLLLTTADCSHHLRHYWLQQTLQERDADYGFWPAQDRHHNELSNSGRTW